MNFPRGSSRSLSTKVRLECMRHTALEGAIKVSQAVYPVVREVAKCETPGGEGEFWTPRFGDVRPE